MAAPLLLGLVPSGRAVGAWAVSQMALTALPRVESVLRDPAASVSRLGDVLVWDAPGGRRVLASLESVQESQGRIEQAVTHIESAQIGIASSLSTLTAISMATLGVTSLATGFMIWRMNALHARMGDIGAQIADIQTHLNANEQAHLRSGLTYLDRFERTTSSGDLDQARKETIFATHLYRHLVQAEAVGSKRLLALNQCGRYYMLSLTAQTRCLLAGGEAVEAEALLRSEMATLSELARVTFGEVIGDSPEIYLDPVFQEHGLTLDSMADVYLRAARLGAVPESAASDAGELFERLRGRVYGAKGWFGTRAKTRTALLAKFKYLTACLEDVERIESLRLRIVAASEGRGSFADLQRIAAEAGRADSESNGAVYGVAYG